MASVPSHSQVDYVRLFADERSTLLVFLEELADDDWDRPTPCPGWSVLDLGAHLVGNDLGLLARQRDGHAGIRAPDDGDESAFIAWLDDMQDNWVHAARRLSPRLVIDLLSWTGPQLVDVLAHQSPTATTASVSWASNEAVPTWLDHARELSECWIHRQQLLEALDRPLDLAPVTTGAILDALRWAYLYRLGSLVRPDGHTAEIVISGPVTRHWFLQSRHGSWDFMDMAGAPIVARLAMTTDQAWRLLSNNLRRDLSLDITGDPDVCDVLRRTRAIIGAPDGS